MKKQNTFPFTLITLLSLLSLNSCLINKPKSNPDLQNAKAAVDNSQGTAPSGYGRLININPIAATNNFSLSPSTDVSAYLSSPEFITFGRTLQGTCNPGTSAPVNCFKTFKDKQQGDILLYSPNNLWTSPVTTPEFLQVNVFGHLNKIISSYLSDLVSTNFQSMFTNNPVGLGQYWMYKSDPVGLKELVAYADIIPDSEKGPGITEWPNARFSPADNELYFGKYTLNGSMIYMAHDASIIYHETGHAFQHMMLNLNNLPATNMFYSNLGTLFYEEAGAIGEGVSDYFSYYMNGRTHFAEWGGGLLNSSRPMSEADSLHAAGVNTDSFSRLSYPDYINYDPNNLQAPRTDSVHMSGMMMSHFLVALTQDLQAKCGLSKTNSIHAITKVLMQTYAALGKYNQGAPLTPNTNTKLTQEMIELNLNINYRTFTQKFADFFYSMVILQPNQNCTGGIYSNNLFEQMLDQYGLLMFSKYGVFQTVSPSNILKSFTIPKSNLMFDPTQNAAQFYVIDDRKTMIDAVTKLNSMMKENISTRIHSSNITIGNLPTTDIVPYNNSNNTPSPGELVAIGLNLYNNSNSVMSGVKILANDWDHVAYEPATPTQFKYCSNFEDFWPGVNLGGILDSNTQNSNSCTTIVSNNANDTTQPNFTYPVCAVQISDANGTRWAPQEEFMNQMGVPATNCLESGVTNECFVRFVRGLDHASISTISPHQNWTSSHVDANGQPILSYHNLLFMEINTNVPVGTKFACRLRANFTNCKDCFEDANGTRFNPNEFSGNKPFKLFNFEFAVGN